MRLSDQTSALPGFEDGDLRIAVLGPLEAAVDGGPGLRKLAGGPDKFTNGHSVLLRIDYGKARILLTGDLNRSAHGDLLDAYSEDPTVFTCDVGKCCHHGSDDVSLRFLQTMNAAATIISSGDVEGHDHPKPRIVAASALTGRKTVKGDELLTPLVYSTELARSHALGAVDRLTLADGTPVEGSELAREQVEFSVRKPSSVRPERGSRRLGGAHVVADLVYGLVNVRTDGKTILCATRNEGKGDWAIRVQGGRGRARLTGCSPACLVAGAAHLRGPVRHQRTPGHSAAPVARLAHQRFLRAKRPPWLASAIASAAGELLKPLVIEQFGGFMALPPARPRGAEKGLLCPWRALAKIHSLSHPRWGAGEPPNGGRANHDLAELAPLQSLARAIRVSGG